MPVDVSSNLFASFSEIIFYFIYFNIYVLKVYIFEDELENGMNPVFILINKIKILMEMVQQN